MKLAIMQPYFFPYIGYFQLIAAVDKFLVYDDVSFIKQGWINRNRLLAGGKPQYFTVPLKDASSSRSIHSISVDENQPWRVKMLKTVEQAYAKAPERDAILPLISRVLYNEANRISDLAVRSIQEVCAYLALATPLSRSSESHTNQHLSGQERVLDICQREACSDYINPPGGKDLYSREAFAARNVRLRFLRPEIVPYPQLSAPDFVPGLSILDVLMFNPKDRVQDSIRRYELE